MYRHRSVIFNRFVITFTFVFPFLMRNLSNVCLRYVRLSNALVLLQATSLNSVPAFFRQRTFTRDYIDNAMAYYYLIFTSTAHKKYCNILKGSDNSKDREDRLIEVSHPMQDIVLRNLTLDTVFVAEIRRVIIQMSIIPLNNIKSIK